MATIYSIAKEAKVSKATVSRVLNHPELVNKKTIDKVNEVIKRQNFKPSYLAQGMRSQKTRTLGLLVPDFSNLYYSELLTQFEQEVYKRGYIPMMSAYGIEPVTAKSHILSVVEKQQIEGFVMPWYLSLNEHMTFFKQLSKIMPVVLMDQQSKDLPFSTVKTDSYNGMRKLTKYFIDKGHKNIAFISGLKKYAVVEERLKGFLDEMSANKLIINNDFIEESEFSIIGGHKACNRIFRNGKPSAVMCAADLVAIGAMMSAYEFGYKIPEDVAVSGFDNIPMANAVYPPLTTVDEIIDKKIITATDLLIQKIENKYTRNSHVVFDVDIVQRTS